MASKGPRSKVDHDTRARRSKALEAPREPHRPKTHWDHVLEEMVWLSKDFESERKWKLAQAKRVALRASKGMLDQATRGERKLKEEEHRMRKVALNISKDVKKFWMKIEKLVLYKHQMELDEKKKKALDKQLEFLLGQTERYSTMLAENLVDIHRPLQQNNAPDCQMKLSEEEADEDRLEERTESEAEPLHETADDEDFDLQTEDESEDDEHTIEEDEALITTEERQEELEALQNEMDVPLEELLKRYAGKESRKTHSGTSEDATVEPSNDRDLDKGLGTSEDATAKSSDDRDQDKGLKKNLNSAGKTETDSATGRRCAQSNGSLSVAENHVSEILTCQGKNHSKALEKSKNQNLYYDFHEEQEDGDFILAGGEDKDDEATLSEEEQLARAESYDPMDELVLLQKESEIPVEELIARYKKDFDKGSVSEDESDYASALSEDLEDTAGPEHDESRNQNVSLIENVKAGEGLMRHSSPEDEREAEVKNDSEVRESDSRIADAAAAARSAQPTGNTFSTTKVRTKFPFLLKYPLREYQHIGLDWLVTMYEKRLNGILADEMGLGKTIMTIALLAHLACEKGIWGPHLIVVPTSVMLNWETEFLKWCPAFKILTYFGSAKERKFKRQGWMKPNSFHVCITTYRLVIQDSKMFKRKKWKYLILDEAHLIKNWKSQRWQTLLTFHSKRRILLTGTPLQNDLMELWSLMHFLMPHIFQSHQEFKDWFCNPISGMVEGQEKVNKEVVDRLHNVLRPFILRRLKRDVEKQLPMKHEHVIYCRLSRRQRNLYEDFIASSETQATLASANFIGMISVIMQLRKVCNHPDLFEGRPIISSFDMTGIVMQLSSSVSSVFSDGPFTAIDLKGLGFLFTHLDFFMTSWESDEVGSIETPSSLIMERIVKEIGPGVKNKMSCGMNIFEDIRKAIQEERQREAEEHAASIAWWNSLRCRKKPMYSTTLRKILTIRHPVDDIHWQKANCLSYLYSPKLADIVLSPVERFERMIDVVESFMFAIPAARSPEPVCWCSKSGSPVFLSSEFRKKSSETFSPLLSPIRPAIVRRQVYFPDRRLIQFDCGKLQELAILLRKLKSEGHRALIFTQMTKMLDVLEAFINLYGYTYMRLDGSTQPEERQTLMQRFNTNPKIFLFILSTRSGGVGINLVGADTVIFYDSDWNPAMDQQAQDRCHRIGQTREVHIYRLISESTIEENILKKANQKRALDDLVIQSGGYNTEFFKKLDPLELFSGHRTLPVKNMQKEKNDSNGADVSNADVEAALKNAEDEADYMALKKVEQEEAVDNQEFTEELIGRMEDDELVNEDDLKDDEPADDGGLNTSLNKENETMINSSNFTEEQALTLVVKEEEDVDMLADVRQMAEAAAAAGQTISSLENQLRPIDRYAIRFLELWDPIIDKATLESQIRFEETEWELDRIEKYKEEMEAEIDDDEEPFVYERWDTDFATEAYRQQVEALAQHQLMEELEMEAKRKEEAETENCDDMSEPPKTSKSKSKKKMKKAKFKSLKKGSLASEAKLAKEEPPDDAMYLDGSDDDDDDGPFYDEVKSFDAPSPHSSMQKKRKKDKSTEDSEEQTSKKKSKKQKTASVEMFPSDPDCNISSKQQSDSDNEQKIPRSRASGKVSTAMTPNKRVVLIKLERFKKADFWPRDRIPASDPWSTQEDAILCAGIHEYGPNWGLISDLLYGMASGGSYRGRFRHPVHCSERFRELIQNYVLSTSDNPHSEKGGSVGSGKALFRVTKDNIHLLLAAVSELPDNELLLQRHFTALLSSIWRVTNPADRSCLMPSKVSSGRLFGYRLNRTLQNSTRDTPRKLKMTNLAHSRRLLSSALHDAIDNKQNEVVCLSDKEEEAPCIEEGLPLTLEIQQEQDDTLNPLPSFFNLSIPGSYRPPEGRATGENYLKSTKHVAESRFREASCACLKESLGWASSAFPTNDAKSRAAVKPQILGKHKLPLSDSVKPPKSKSRKTNSVSAHAGDHRDLLSYPMPPSSPYGDPNLKFDYAEPAGAPADDFKDNFKSVMDGDLSLQIETSEPLPHDYNPGLLSGLDDYSSLPEYTDIG